MELSHPINLILIITIFSQNILYTASQDLSGSPASTLDTNRITLDLSKCECTSTQESCDLTILKSSLLEERCGDGETLCCSMTTSVIQPELKISPAPTTDSSGESSSEPSELETKGNVRVYAINPVVDPSLKVSSLEQNTLKMKKSNCACKARSSCPHKYIDYGFGFHCTYSTVRCCVPEEDEVVQSQVLTVTSNIANAEENVSIATTDLEGVDLANITKAEEEGQVEATSETDVFPSSGGTPVGELLITEVNNLWKAEDYSQEDDCVCLPLQKCRLASNLDTNSIERRRDTLCPGELIQCCGGDVLNEITKKKDDTAELDMTNIPKEYPPYHQPVQLATQKIPSANETEHDEEGSSPPLQAATLAPPVLPTQYHSYEPSSYHRGYNYPPSQFSGPQNYRQGVYGKNGENIRPWVALSSPSTYSNQGKYAQHGYPRGPYPDEARASKPGGLFDTLKQYLG